MLSTLPNFERFCEGDEREDLSHLEERLSSYYSPLYSALSGPERYHLAHYKREGYRQINRFLRTNQLPNLSDQAQSDLLEGVESISATLQRFTLPFSTVVYRSLRGDYPDGQLCVGRYLEEPGFMSTTLSAQVARRICAWESQDVQSTVLEISVPEGTHALWLEGVTSLPGLNEYEVLLTSDVVVHISAIKDVEGYPDRRYVQCQCVQT